MAAAASENCRDDQVLVGFEVAYATDPPTVHGLAALCGVATVTADVQYLISIGDVSKLGPRGSRAPNTALMECPKDQAVVGFFGRAGGLLDQLGLRCAPLVANADAGTVTTGAQTPVGPLPTPAGGSEFNEPCPDNGVARGYIVNFGARIDALALHCGRPTLVP